MVVAGGIMDFLNPDSDTSQAPNSEQKTTTTNPTPEEVLSPEEAIKKKAEENLSYKKRLRDVQITTNDGQYSVKVILNADSNLSANLTKQSVRKDVSSVFYGLFKEDAGVEYAVVTTYYPTVDAYGNKNEAIIYQARLVASEAKKINWSQDKTQVEASILPDLWETELDKLDQL
ncbi:hypothetical protein H3C66_01825 [Patescibacteria group bacterium]|nr:hypothetical protein [Patescibacteria group bacterium]